MEKILDDAVTIAMPKINKIFDHTTKHLESRMSLPGENSTTNVEEKNAKKSEETVNITQTDTTNPTPISTANTKQTDAVNSSTKSEIFQNIFRVLRYLCVIIALAIIRSIFNHFNSHGNHSEEHPKYQRYQYAAIPGGHNPYVRFEQPPPFHPGFHHRHRW